MSPELQSRILYGIIAGLISLLFLAVAWFVVREILKRDKMAENLRNFEETMRKDMSAITDKFSIELRLVADRNTEAIRGLSVGIQRLAETLGEQRVFLAENYTAKPEFERQLATIHTRISNQNQKIDKQAKEILEITLSGVCPRHDCPMCGKDPRNG